MSDRPAPLDIAAVVVGLVVGLLGLASVLSFADHLLYLSDRDAMSQQCLERFETGVTGDLRISPGENGLLCDAGSASSLAAAMLRAIEDRPLAARAAEQNPKLIAQRADYAASMRQAEEFYEELV